MRVRISDWHEFSLSEMHASQKKHFSDWCALSMHTSQNCFQYEHTHTRQSETLYGSPLSLSLSLSLILSFSHSLSLSLSLSFSLSLSLLHLILTYHRVVS